MWRPWSCEESTSMEVEENHRSDGEEESEPGHTPQVKKHVFLSPGQKAIILNVYTTLKEDNILPPDELIKEAARLTKIHYQTVWRIVRHGISERKIRSDSGISKKLNEVEHAHLIRRIIYNSYDGNFVPTLRSLQQKVNETAGISICVETLRKFLLQIGFTHKVLNKRSVIMETSAISEWRFNYLNEVKKRRDDGRPIIYLDETWFNSYDTVNKGWIDSTRRCVVDVPSGKGHRIIILHAGSNNGWVNNCLLLSAKNIKHSAVDYHDDMSSEIFMDWFQNKLLPNLPKNSVIVMDNASYHSVQKTKIPNTNSRKMELMEFLEKHDLYFEENYTKKQLLEVLKTRKFAKEFVADEAASNFGHEVLRLPPYHCIFNPIEMIWAQLKQNLRRNNTNPKFSEQTIELIKDEVAKIGETIWANCERHVLEIEDSYRAKHVKELIINLDDSDSDSDDMCNSDCEHN